MTNRTALNIVGILLLFLLFVAFVKFALVGGPFGFSAGNDTDKYAADFQNNAMIVLGSSLVCVVIWFALGEWVISATSEAITWTLTWLVLLLVTLGVGIYYAFQAPVVDQQSLFGLFATYYLLIGFLSFYLSSVLFSPTNAMYAIWPAKHIRRW